MAANQRDVRVKNLSNNVLGMKFMSRTQEATKREQLEEEQKKKQAEAHWNLDFIDREELTNSFNKEIEKVASEMDKADRAARARQNEDRESVSAKEMTNRYKTLVGGGAVGAKEADAAKKRKRDSTPPGHWSDMAGRTATRFKHLNSMGFMKPE
ncbi:hypothetical protein HK097_007712 [Rhizophlyctis rosea]|uniref:Uncharacterized protein n=1 Tax=Rhizophlyctis rosea TaxID=64517 RepID=A0AAD5SK81_9FUNG|nr:hypothetical protein HK097_007712 [Rhizophlyctis rosea]